MEFLLGLSTKYRTAIVLTNRGACRSAMLLKMISRLLGRIPALSGSPDMVYVLPELVMP